MTNTWLVLLPTIIVLISAFTIKKLNISLGLGILSAALIASDFSVIKIFPLIATRFWENIADIKNIYLLLFIVLLGIIVALLAASGGASAFAKVVTKRAKNAKMAESSSIMLSFALFIDDYLSNLKVGYIMRPITDKFKIPRAKLAFLVHSMAGALVVITPFSNWGAFISGELKGSGVTKDTHEIIRVFADPFFSYMKCIPFIFYSFLIIASVIFIVKKRISFGPMKKHEDIAKETGNLFGGRTDVKTHELEKTDQEGSLADLIVPLASLILSIIIGFLYSGGYYLLGGTKSFVGALQNLNNAFLVVFISGVFSLAVSFAFALVRKKIKAKKIPGICVTGAKMMYEPLIMILLAWTLGGILGQDLQTGSYLAHLLLGSLSIKLVPLMLFITSAICGIATGTSWGTMMLLIPISVPMIIGLAQLGIPTTLDKIAILIPSLGAIFSGAVCGDHISPISETTIMASMSSGSTPVDHTYTQMPYAIPSIIGCCVAFLTAGFLIDYSWWASCLGSIAIGLVVSLGLLTLMNKKR